jgi:hypothetical protein
MEAFLIHIGVNPVDLFAGFAGGLIAALAVAGPRPNLWSIFSSIVIGAFSAAYLGPLVPGWLPVWMGVKAGPGASFGTGVAGTPLCRVIIYFAQNLRIGNTGLKENKDG